jgi:hypothetical protein
MTKTEEMAIEKEVETLHAEWSERREARDTQAAITLANVATFYMFQIVDGVKS